jgi:hypothetical protein
MKPERQCVAVRRGKGRCLRSAIKGGTVCYTHGGASGHIRRKAAERLADLIDPDRALREAARLAYSDIRELVDENGKLLPLKKLPDHIAAAVSAVKVRKDNAVSGDGVQEDVVEVKLWDKSKNLEMLFKHLNLLVERLHVDVTVSLPERLKAARLRDPNAETLALPPGPAN